ncbi:MAG TPA: VC1465 family Xer recombination activation factor [Burkholderiaceae bacterium]
MLASLGLDVASGAKFLHVTERTLHNWFSGKHAIPFAAYKLVRMHCGMELPGKSWAGWRLQGGVLVSPEGYPFRGTDSAWWSALVRRARLFGELVQENDRLRRELALRRGFAPQGGQAQRRTPVEGGALGLSVYQQRAREIDSPDQNDVKLTSWPILSDFPPLSMPKPAPVASISASPSMPCSVSPWMPICGGLPPAAAIPGNQISRPGPVRLTPAPSLGQSNTPALPGSRLRFPRPSGANLPVSSGRPAKLPVIEERGIV